jgi:glucose-1-phosphate cytidylyltransferase
MKDNSMSIHQNNAEPWTVTLVDTGESTLTGGRLKRVQEYVKDEDAFCFTYGDGVSDVNIADLIKFHQEHGKLATLTATRPPGRYGALKITNNSVEMFQEKPEGDGSWINGGYFILSPEVIKNIDGDDSIWEQEPLKKLAKDGELMSFKHDGFWQPMDTLHEKTMLNNLWNSNNAPWKKW